MSRCQFVLLAFITFALSTSSALSDPPPPATPVLVFQRSRYTNDDTDSNVSAHSYAAGSLSAYSSDSGWLYDTDFDSYDFDGEVGAQAGLDFGLSILSDLGNGDLFSQQAGSVAVNPDGQVSAQLSGIQQTQFLEGLSDQSNDDAQGGNDLLSQPVFGDGLVTGPTWRLVDPNSPACPINTAYVEGSIDVLWGSTVSTSAGGSTHTFSQGGYWEVQLNGNQIAQLSIAPDGNGRMYVWGWSQEVDPEDPEAEPVYWYYDNLLLETDSIDLPFSYFGNEGDLVKVLFQSNQSWVVHDNLPFEGDFDMSISATFVWNLEQNIRTFYDPGQ